MKKLLVCALVAAMSFSTLVGCGSSATEPAEETTTEEAATTEETTTEETTTEETEAAETAEVTEVQDISLKVWCPQNQVDTGIMEQQQAAFAELHPEWNITWTTEIVGEDKAVLS